MTPPRVALFAPLSAFSPSGEPTAPPSDHDAVVDAALAAVAPGGWVTLEGPEPLAHPGVVDIVAALDGAGRRVRLVTNGWRLAEPSALERLRDAGVAQLMLTWWGGDANTHDVYDGRAGAFDRLQDIVDRAGRMARLLTIARYVLTPASLPSLGAWVPTIRNHAARLDLLPLAALDRDPANLAAHRLPRRPMQAAIQEAWEAARTVHLKMTASGLGTWPPLPVPTEAPIQPADATLLDLLRAGVAMPSVTNGTWATPSGADVDGLWRAAEVAGSLADLGLELAAWGAPALDLPASLGGWACDTPPGAPETAVPLRRENGVPLRLARTFDAIDTTPLPETTGLPSGAKVAVVVGESTDNISALSTFPALVDALRAEGCDARLASLWHDAANPWACKSPPDHVAWLPAGERLEAPVPATQALAHVPACAEYVRANAPAWLASSDWSDCDAIVVAGFETAFHVLTHPSLRPNTRVIVADFHLMTGYARWTQHFPRLPGPGAHIAWPSRSVEVHAIYPRSVRTYARARVPMRQLSWMPYPIHLPHFPPGPPIDRGMPAFAGGAHQRDWATLAQAVSRRGPQAVDDLLIHASDALPRPLRNQGRVRLLEFHAAIASSRYVVLPLRPEDQCPAGISVISLALAAGRPVIATLTAATVDHLRHGVNALLVPPGNAAALAEAMQRLDDDTALRERLAAGAAAAAPVASVEAWARRIAHGAPATRSWSLDGEPRGPFYAWPHRPDARARFPLESGSPP